MEFIRINRDINGNSRYVLHFCNIADTYDRALFIARKVGGKKYRSKRYGGGIVFQSVNLAETEAALKTAIAEANN